MPNYGVQTRAAPEPPVRFDGHHIHDFEMTFPNPDYPMDYELRCACGETATDMREAVRLTNLTRETAAPDLRKAASIAFLVAAAAFFVWAMGRGLFW